MSTDVDPPSRGIAPPAPIAVVPVSEGFRGIERLPLKRP